MYLTTKFKRDRLVIDCDRKDECQRKNDDKCESCKHCKSVSVVSTKYVIKELLFEDLGFKGKVLRIFLYALLVLLVVVMPITVIGYLGYWIFS